MSRAFLATVLLATALVPTEAAAAPPPEIQLWLVGLGGTWRQCQTQPPVFRKILGQSAATTSRRQIQYLRWNTINPYFAFNGTPAAPKFSCRQNGPHRWDGEEWFVQDIAHLRPPSCNTPALGALCTTNVVRICSLKRIRPEGSPPTAGPFNTSVGRRGCGLRWVEEYAAPLPMP